MAGKFPALSNCSFNWLPSVSAGFTASFQQAHEASAELRLSAAEHAGFRPSLSLLHIVWSKNKIIDELSALVALKVQNC